MSTFTYTHWNRYNAGGTQIKSVGRYSLYERDGTFAVLGYVETDGSMPILLETTDRAEAEAFYQSKAFATCPVCSRFLRLRDGGCTNCERKAR